MKAFQNFFLFIAIILLSAINAQAQNKLKVTVTDIESRTGTIYAALCTPDSNFPYGDGIQKAEVKVKKKGKVVLKFNNVPEGTYAIRLYQDLDGNKEMDMEGQRPAEPFGFSRLKSLMGPPSFEACKFQVPSKEKVTVKMLSMF
jgi:uncharacterized protein (DUF2141 family)